MGGHLELSGSILSNMFDAVSLRMSHGFAHNPSGIANMIPGDLPTLLKHEIQMLMPSMPQTHVCTICCL